MLALTYKRNKLPFNISMLACGIDRYVLADRKKSYDEIL